MLIGNKQAYVTQEDVMLGTLTVRETITYSAHLRLPKEDVEEAVATTITEMGLEECADRMIGNWHFRGISGGEKKRLSIALEILTRPHLLFLDEPTSGLDSAAAFFVVQTLRNIARDGHRTVITSIHQPSSEVFTLFDDLCLLSAGETVFFGEAKMAVEFFTEAGFPCPSRRNPSDHFLRCINSDFDIVTKALLGSRRMNDSLHTSSDLITTMTTSEIKEMLIRTYNRSKYAKKAHTRIFPKISDPDKSVEVLKRSEVGCGRWWKQLWTLTKRSSLNMSRDIGYYWLRIAIYIVLSFCVGTVFYDVGTVYTAIYARGSCGAFISGFMTFMSIGGFPSFIEEMKVFHRERLNGHYGVAVFILSNFLSSFPFLVILTVSTIGITYNMVKFHSGFPHFLYACLDLLSCISVVESCMMIIASLVPNFLMGIITGAGFIGIMMMTAGYFRQLSDLPKIFWRYPISYINYSSWGLQGAFKNDMIGLEFDSLVPGGEKLKGEFIISDILGVPLHHSKWWDLAAVLAILVSYRVFFFAILKMKERGSPWLHKLYANSTLRRLEKRPSFRKTPFTSKRHQNLHSLSSQEGLNSPLH